MINTLSASPEWIIVDWGTTNFRAFIMSADNTCIERIERKTGLLQVKDRAFEDVLRNNLAQWFDASPNLPVFMAGMIGSKQGWHEADYISTPLSLTSLSDACLRFNTTWGSEVLIVPGVCHSVNESKFDVMRGEEVQLLGLLQLGFDKNCFAILPGTHSKHAQISDGKLHSFSTFMTGEFFALLSEHSILGKNLSEQILSPDVFAKGVIDGQEGNLMHTAFMARTHRLFGQIEESEIHDYISGLLIGKEVADIDDTTYIISNAQLGKRYAIACGILNKVATTISGDDCFIAGMSALREQVLCQTTNHCH
ncbi:2-dehydro-3-deoxygalactonokinase [Alginatibacterium sediminis]|uniref:2-dehydro-3-deoxygalactonokinase n=1 Tax=Alginatibacterium sediminis TaxID=2164068 RepID=UPI001314680D|nr:2-dehydro-3-deoxygalactonokinase [Alginatibacterium sediminis]